MRTLTMILLLVVGCDDDNPPPADAALPLCSALGCDNTFCTGCVTQCGGTPCYVPEAP